MGETPIQNIYLIYYVTSKKHFFDFTRPPFYFYLFTRHFFLKRNFNFVGNEWFSGTISVRQIEKEEKEEEKQEEKAEREEDKEKEEEKKKIVKTKNNKFISKWSYIKNIQLKNRILTKFL